MFIDTQSFVNAGLHFDGLAFKLFRKYCETKELIHVSTSVVESEVKSKIESSVKDALSAFKTFRRKARILASLDDEKIKVLFEEITHIDIYQKSEEVFDEFMSACFTEIVKANDVNAEDLLSLYFNREAPFGDGKKKSEFPDAISILSLKSYLKDGEKIYVVSDDGDLKAYCYSDPSFISVDSLDKLLDVYTTHTSVRHEQVKHYLTTNEASIKLKIREFLEDCEVYNLSTWENAEVDDGLSVLNVGDINPSVLYINDKESQITFDIDVEFEVTVTGPDFKNGIFDSEDGCIYTFDSTSRTEAILTTFTVEIFLNYEFIDGVLENVEDEDLDIIGTSGGIEVSVEEDGHSLY